jgi:uncharacterized protein (TIGR02466 family)
MFRDKSVLPLFPSNVWVHDLEPSVFEAMNERVRARIEELIDPRPDIEPGQTWQTRNDLQDDPAFAELLEIAHQAIDGVLEFLQAERLPMEVTGAWANINPPGSPHRPHVHPNNYLSAVYFVHSPPGADTITFYDPRERAAMITPQFTKLTKHNSLSINVEARTGRLAVFPAWLKHSVLPNESREERITFAMNFMFSDFTHSISRPQWEGL